MGQTCGDIGLNVTHAPSMHDARRPHPLRSASISGLFWLTGTNKSDVESWGHCVIASDPSVSPPMGGLSETFYTNTLWRVSFTVFDREIRSLVVAIISNAYYFFFFNIITFSTFNVDKNTQYILYDCGKFFLEEILRGNDIISFEKRWLKIEWNSNLPEMPKRNKETRILS